ncbi:MAG: 2-polyprenyl-6-methoxyphenol hydroxylase [Proteobacteria bacterium SG_bin9]|nr:MAG: 2-polyprenyl-6-methoxyphenol hydroxylase [Proteobacteria bacterium SG_bin9]
MLSTDVAIVGGGLAGSTAAAMLGRAGIRVVLIDPNEIYPPDFRCEKLDSSQVAVLRKTGLADDILPATTHDGSFWIARFGRLIDKRPGDQNGVMYDTLVNTVRKAIPASVTQLRAKATELSTSRERQHITLSNGDSVSARLIILANGLNIGLRHALGIERKVMSPNHSITVGFDLKPVGRPSFDFSSLTYYAERPSDRMAYLTLFPIGNATRANLFTYRNVDDPMLREIRQNPVKVLHDLMPGLGRITGAFDVEGPVKVRPIDLYVSEGHLQPGIVLVGDAFATSCPAGGTGTSKVFTDVERLCNVYVPEWLKSNGMGDEKIATFYRDPVKLACDMASSAKAYQLKSISIDNGLIWHLHRWARFVARAATGFARSLRTPSPARPIDSVKPSA